MISVVLFFMNSCTGSGQAIDDLNVLLITLDTTRADYIGAYGHKTVKTPHIDALCRKGIMFRHCYSPVPLTLPAHSSIFTGQYPIGHGVRNNSHYHLASREGILTKLLKEKGYHTHAVIAAFVLIAKFGLNQGFDVYEDSFSTSEIPADAVYERFKGWFGANHDKQFFSWVHFYDPHKPYEPPARYIEKGSEDDDSKLYAGEVEYVDEQVGKIIEDLKAAGTLDKTLVIIVGDHGEAFGEHNEYGHSVFFYEETIKVPLIFYNENMFEHKIIDRRVNLVDVMPTLLDLLHIKIPAAVQGQSMLPMMRGKEEEKERTFYLESIYGSEELNWAPLTGLIEDDYKFISAPEPELYNLKTDPEEKNNLFLKKFNIARKYDARLGELILAYSTPGSTEKAKRNLTDKDARHLKSLGYISAFSNKSKEGSLLDPKQGIIIHNKLKKFAKQIKKNENLDEIETELKKILTGKPEFVIPLVYTQLHEIYKKRKDAAAALKILEDGVKEFPDLYRFRNKLAEFLFELKRYDDVVEQCRLVLKKNPLSARTYSLLGDVCFFRQNLDESKKHFREAMKLEPDNIQVKMKLADIMMREKKYAEAVNIYNLLLDADEMADNHNFLFKVAMMNTRYGTMATAEGLFHRLVNIHPSGKYYFYYAIALSRNKKYRQAMQIMETALDKYPHDLTSEQRQQAEKALGVWKRNY